MTAGDFRFPPPRPQWFTGYEDSAGSAADTVLKPSAPLAPDFAHWSFALGVFSLFCGPTGLLAVILGALSLFRASSNKTMAMGGIASGSIGMLLSAAVLIFVAHRDGRGAAAASSGERATGPYVVEVSCRYTATRKKLACPGPDEPACPKPGEEPVCRSEILRALTGGKVNNWKNDGSWNGYKDRVTFITLAVDGVKERRGKTCYHADQDAAIWLCPEGRAPRDDAKLVVGYGRMVGYEQGLIEDDLDVDLLEDLDVDAARREAAALDLDSAVSDYAAGDRISGNAAFEAAYETAAAKLERRQLREVVFLRDPALLRVVDDLEAKRAAAAEAQEKKEATEALEREAEAPARYPALCSSVPAETHVAVDGRPDLCIPKHPAILAISLHHAGPVTPKLGSVPTAYGDDDDLAPLLAPNIYAAEKSALSSADRASGAQRIRTTTYRLQSAASDFAKWSFAEASGRLTGSVDLSDHRMYLGPPPRVKRSQKCDTLPGMTCSKPCTDHDDCNKFLCGCPESRCVFFRCTGCPSHRICEDPTFELTSTPWMLTTTIRTPTEREVAAALDGGDYHVVFLFGLLGAWRDVAVERSTSDGFDDTKETSSTVVNDTGYFVSVRPTLVTILKCGMTCGKLSKPVIDVMPPGRWSTMLEGEGIRVAVACQAGQCVGKVGK